MVDTSFGHIWDSTPQKSNKYHHHELIEAMPCSIGVRGYPYGICCPWVRWDGAWMAWENSSAAAALAVAVVVAHLGPTLVPSTKY